MTISIYNRKFKLQLPKTDRHKLSCDSRYRIVLQHEVTKRVHVLKLEDLTVCGIRFVFAVELPGNFQDGTYCYYLIPNDQWQPDDINHNNIRSSYQQSDVSGIMNGDNFLVAGNTLLITDYYLTKVEDLFEATGIKFMAEEKYNYDTCDVGGKLVYKELDIIQTGLLKYNVSHEASDSSTFKSNPQEEFITFKSIR